MSSTVRKGQLVGSMSRLSQNIIYNLAGQSLLAALSFVAAKFVFKQLGAEALGIIYFTLTLNLVLSAVLAMGINETTVREISSHSTSDPGYVGDLIRTASLFYWGAYALFALVIFLAAPLLVHRWINLGDLGPGMAIRVIRILGIACLVALPRSFYTSLLCGLQRMEFNNGIDVSVSALQQLGIVLILIMGGRLPFVIYWMSACFALSIISYLVICAHFFSWHVLVPGYIGGIVGRNFAYTSHMAIISLLAIIHMQADKLIVSKLLPIGLFGLYTVAYGAVSRTSSMSSAIFQGSFPHLSALHNARERLIMLSQYRKLQDLVCLATIPLFAGVIFAAMPLFTLLFNAQAARLLFLPVVFLCTGFYMNGALTIPYAFSLAVGRPDISARSNLYALFIVPPTTVVLVHRFGLNGASCSWVLYNLFAYIYALPRICRECLVTSTLGWYSHVLKAIALACLTYGGAALILPLHHSILSLCGAYVLASLLFVSGTFALMGSELRLTISSLVRNCRSRYAEISPIG
jgi:O-antigen/teichoic acid export membrane protein